MKRKWLWILILAIFTTACQQEMVEPTAVPTVTQIVTASPEPTITNTLMPTPTPYTIEIGENPVRMGTPLPEVEPITLDNIDRLEEIGRWGYGSLHDAAFTSDSSQIIAIFEDGLRWFDTQTLEEIRFSPYDLTKYSSMVFSPTLEYFYCISPSLENEEGKRIYLFSVATKEMETIDVGVAFIETHFSQDGSQIILFPYNVSLDEYAMVWDIKGHKWVSNNYPISFHVQSLPDGSGYYMLKGDLNKEMELFFVNQEGDKEQIDIVPEYFINDFHLTSDGRYLGIAFGNALNIAVWDRQEEEFIFYQCYTSDEFCHTELQAQFQDIQYDTDTGNEQSKFPYVNIIGFSQDNRYIILDDHEDSIVPYQYVFDLTTGELVLEISMDAHFLLSPDSKQLLVIPRYLVVPLQIYQLDNLDTAIISDEYWGGRVKVSPLSNYFLWPQNSTINIFDFQTGSLIIKQNFEEFGLKNSSSIIFAQENLLLLSVPSEDNRRIWSWNFDTNETQELLNLASDASFWFSGIYSDNTVLQFANIYGFYEYLYSLESERFKQTATFQFKPAKPEIYRKEGNKVFVYSVDPITLEETLIETITAEFCRDDYGYLNISISKSGNHFKCPAKGRQYLFNTDETFVFDFLTEIESSNGVFIRATASTNDDKLWIVVDSGYRVFVIDAVENQRIAELPIPNTIFLEFSTDDRYLLVNTYGYLYIYGVPLED